MNHIGQSFSESKTGTTLHVLIDYENVQPDILALCARDDVRVHVFVGALQTKISIDLAQAIQGLGSRASYVRISGNGPNALDFHVAYSVGHLSALDPDARFLIVSKDTGFDPLILHLCEKGIVCERVPSPPEKPVAPEKKSVPQNGSEERVKKLVACLRRQGAAKPKRRKSLQAEILCLFGKQLDTGGAGALIDEMQRRGIVSFNGDKIVYALPKTAA
ncbi:hypothetical protein CFR75_15285 [Komagataeibacter xylinus]|uniref:PIN-like domain-containing protein n=1 Tax=Komagataeibacter xylinus TaxID=28448 RepID=A0A318PYF1_KOMXY|nr:PIN domain-containing protein [Komagataeibacter xylinus]PYD55657.1 hypothetical protein CFR75_15285 [Komagataeibacter xylinus]GBQ78446.1 hypothetical protein AA15237_2716 [Komagataeibacter xylinus NBRC 15237]